MRDEAKRIVRELKKYARRYADGSTLGRAIVDTELVMTDAANMINQLKSDREAWQRRAEAAEHDLRSAIKSADVHCDLCAHHHECNGCENEELCTRNYEFGTCPAMENTPCNGCDFENHFQWRGPCEERRNQR